MPLFDARRKRNPIVLMIAYFIAAVLFADSAIGNYLDGKSYWKQALAASLWILATLITWWRRRLEQRRCAIVS